MPARRHLQHVIDSAIDFAIVVTDLRGIVTDWNAGAENILGWQRDEIIDQSAERIFTVEDRAIGRLDEEMRLARVEGRASDERWHLRKSGDRFWASGEMMPLRREDGAQHGYVKILRDRTRQQQAGERLREREDRFRALLETIETAFAIVEVRFDADDRPVDYRFLEANPAFERQAGVNLRGKWVTEFAPNLERFWFDTYGHVARTGEPANFENYAEAFGRWFDVRAVRVGDPADRQIAILFNDITAQREARDALARSEQRYRALFDSIDEGFCVIRFIDGPHGPMSDYVHVEANPAFEHHLGIPHVAGQTLRDIAPDDETGGWLAIYGEVLRTGRPTRVQRAFVPTGRHLEVSAHRVEPASRREVAVLFTDVTARKQAEAALRASEAKARENAERVQLALAAGAIIGTWNWHLPTDRFTVDEAFAVNFGLDPALGRIGLSLAQVVETVHPDDRAGLAAAMDEAIARGGRYAHQYRVRRRDGRYYWLEANGHVEHAPEGTPLSFPGVLLDVEQRRTIEAERDRNAAALRALNETLESRIAQRTAELMKAEEQLRQSQKMEAVGQLTGGLAHDFNNLLAGISGALDLMSTRLAQGRLTDLDRYMTAAQGAAKRAAALTHRLLAFSRRQTLDPRPTDVNALVNGMTDLIQRTVGPSIVVEAVAGAGLWSVLVDASQLENALLNLCINARDAMPDGGRITIETANRWLDRDAARMHDLAEGQYLSLCVIDTGTGMPPEIVAKVFEPFFTTKPLGQGTGLGLSMIYGFAQQSGGQVRVVSEVGQGTTVCIYLPRHDADAVADVEASGQGAAVLAQAEETVLIVDDEPTVRMLVTDVLEDLGYTVIEAADSVAGLKVLRSDVRIDLLVTDVGLPGGMNGRQMADAGRELRPTLKTLFITGYAENAALGNGHLQPGMQVLTKPFAVDALAARVRELIAS